MGYARVNPSTAQTNEVLIPVDENGFVRVRSLYISSDSEMEVSLVNSEDHTDLFKIYVGARGGVIVPYMFQSNPGQGVDYNTSASENIFIAAEFDYVVRPA